MKKIAEDIAIKGMLHDESDRCLALMEQIRLKLLDYPRGSLVVKRVKSGNHVYEYYHLQWRAGSQVLSRHISSQDLPDIKKQLIERDSYKVNLNKLKARIAYLAVLLRSPK